MSLLDVVKSLAAYFAEQGCPASVVFGGREIARHAGPNRVVIVASKRPDRFAPPQQIQTRGPALASQQTASYVQQVGGQSPRSIATRVVQGDAIIWAKGAVQHDSLDQPEADQRALDALVNMTVLGLHRIAPGNDRVLSGSQTQEPYDVTNGLVYTLAFQVEVPIVDTMWCDGLIDTETRTYPVLPAGFGLTVQEVKPDGSVLSSVTFEPSSNS